MNVILKVLGWAWASPLTALGVILAFLGGAAPKRTLPAGVWQFVAKDGGLWSWFFRKRDMGAVTCGAVTIFVPAFYDDTVMVRHEREHTYQAFVLGVFFLPAYYAASLVAKLRGDDPYFGNWFEERAYAVEHNTQS